MALSFHRARKTLFSTVVRKCCGIEPVWTPDPEPFIPPGSQAAVGLRIANVEDYWDEIDYDDTGLPAPGVGQRTVIVTHRKVILGVVIVSNSVDVDAFELAAKINSRIMNDVNRATLREENIYIQGGSPVIERPTVFDNKSMSACEFTFVVGIADVDVESLLDSTWIEDVDFTGTVN